MVVIKGTETDAEIVALCRLEMQEIIERTDFSLVKGEDLADSTGMPHGMVRLIAADLTEVGVFELDVPPAAYAGLPPLIARSLRRHWVYRHRDGNIVTLQLSARIKLRLVGYCEAPAFFNHVNMRS